MKNVLSERFSNSLKSFLESITRINTIKVFGRVSDVYPFLIECVGISNAASVGNICCVISTDSFSTKKLYTICEVISVRKDKVQLLPFKSQNEVKIGDLVRIEGAQSLVYPDLSWQGRVINALGEPIDGLGPLPSGHDPYPLKSEPLPFHKRKKIGSKISLGTKAIDIFIPCCFGQRLGIFSGSGIGKSTLVSMLTKYAKVDVKVVALIGERSREAKEFIDQYLEENLSNAVIISSTGDESPVMKKRAAYLAMTISEYFRDQGLEVLFIMDSITRFAMAQREIGLAIGEFPVNKGYPPSVFSELPKLLERAGPGNSTSSITGLFTVLVEGDDHQEPISDALRAILDGHVVLSSAIASRGRFPAVDVLRSISRSAPSCYSKYESEIVLYARRLLATYQNMEEMIRLGIYKKGTDSEIDLAIKYYDKIELFLNQMPHESLSSKDSYLELAQILEINEHGKHCENTDQNK
jgi:flagellum-specific ATP synthase